MNITVDANILVSELSGREQIVRSFLLGPSFERLYMAEYAWEEAQNELPKRFDRMVRGGRFSRQTADFMLSSALLAITFRITIVTPDIYGEFETPARLRIPDDPDDWHTVAVAMATKTAIWTLDQRHFFGCGMTVWKTSVLRAVITAGEG